MKSLWRGHNSQLLNVDLHAASRSSRVEPHFNVSGGNPKRNVAPPFSLDTMLRALERQDSLDFPPGRRFEYSNSGYILLALITEKASGQPYSHFLNNHILERLGMTATFVHDESSADIPGRARQYSRLTSPNFVGFPQYSPLFFTQLTAALNISSIVSLYFPNLSTQ